MIRGGGTVWLAVLVVCGFGALGCGAEPSAGTSSGSGDMATPTALKPAPEFTLKDIHGESLSLSDYRGKRVVVDFWATWCPPCLFQVPELNKLWAAHRETGDVAVIGVAVDVEGVEVVGPWVEEQAVEYPIVLGDEALAREFGALGFPTLAIIDADGNIESLHVGLVELEELENLVQGGSESG